MLACFGSVAGVSAVKVLAIVLILLVLPLVYIYFAQDGMIFLRPGMHPGTVDEIKARYKNAEEIRLKTPDGVELHGWFVSGKGDADAETPLMIYFGGNAEEVSWMAEEAEGFLEGWSLVLINYRGYGLSGGRPGEKAMFSDAELIYDTFTAREGVSKHMVVLMGRSLGTGVAVHLASVRPVKGVVLVSPYDSLSAVAKRHYPLLPVGMLMRHRFDSIRKAPSISAPMLALVAGEDGIIPPEHSKKLAGAWGGHAEIKVITGVGHNGISGRPEYSEYINGFLAGLIRKE